MLAAFLDLAGQLHETEAFHQRLCARSADLQDHEGWF